MNDVVVEPGLGPSVLSGGSFGDLGIVKGSQHGLETAMGVNVVQGEPGVSCDSDSIMSARGDDRSYSAKDLTAAQEYPPDEQLKVLVGILLKPSGRKV